jgi:hypothetical protein
MQKQEKAFTSWMNTLLQPYTPDFLRSRMEDEQAEALTSRRLTAQGHNVRLIHAKAVRPFVGGNKTDAADARAIWLAIQQPGTKFVGMKTLEQQATLVLHRQRELLMKMKAMQSNALRGLLYEFGATFARGKNALFAEIETALEALVGDIPQYVADSLREQVKRVKDLAKDIKASYNMAYTNTTCQSVNEEARSRLIKKREPYEMGKTLRCRSWLNVKRPIFNANK